MANTVEARQSWEYFGFGDADITLQDPESGFLESDCRTVLRLEMEVGMKHFADALKSGDTDEALMDAYARMQTGILNYAFFTGEKKLIDEIVGGQNV